MLIAVPIDELVCILPGESSCKVIRLCLSLLLGIPRCWIVISEHLVAGVVVLVVSCRIDFVLSYLLASEEISCRI